jgi:DNA-binding transcriptional LysR family regulator
MIQPNTEQWPSIEQLYAFVELAEYADINTTAARRHISPSQLAEEIAHLEALLGIRLFVIEHTRYTPSSAGLTFVEQARLILAHHNTIKSLRHLNEQPLGTLDILFEEWLPHASLVSLLSQLRFEQPNLSVRYRRQTETTPIDSQLLISFSHHAVKPGWQVQPWLDIPLVKASHPDQQLLPSTLQNTTCLFDMSGTHPAMPLLNGESLVIQALLQNLGWAILPRNCVADHLERGTLIDWNEPLRDLTVYWHISPTFPLELRSLIDNLLNQI